ncbi:hypothetical protein D3C81_1381230 [compost metagenome]
MHGRHHLAGVALDALDHLTDFFDRILGAPGQVAHLVGNHGKATSGFTGAGRFDRSVERQQVGLLGDAADHLQHRADLFAVLRQHFDFGHGFAHLIGQQGDIAGAALDDCHPVLGRTVGAARGIGGTGGAVGDVMGSGAHLVGGGGDLVDFAELHLHALAGTLGNGRRLVCSAAGLGDALLDLGDGRLQLVEEAVEA